MTKINKLDWLSTDTLQSIMRDLEKEWTSGPRQLGVGEIAILHDFIEEVEKAIKERIIPGTILNSSGSLAQITGV
jgi:hypothetical protein